jgi:hypothetical protein
MCSLVVKERPAQGRTVLVLAVLKREYHRRGEQETELIRSR